MFEHLTAIATIEINAHEGSLLSFGQRVSNFSTTTLPIPVVYNPEEMNTGLMETVGAILKTTCYKSDNPELEAKFEKVHAAWESFIIAKFENVDDLEAHFHFKHNSVDREDLEFGADDTGFDIDVCIKMRLEDKHIPLMHLTIELDQGGEKFVHGDTAVERIVEEFENVVLSHESGMPTLRELSNTSVLQEHVGERDHRDSLNKVMNAAAFHEVSAKLMRKVVIGQFTGTVESSHSPISNMKFTIHYKPQAETLA